MRPTIRLAFNLPDGCRYEFVEVDVLTTDLTALFASADAVIHLAALTNGARADLRAQMERVNVGGHRTVARACAAMGIGCCFRRRPRQRVRTASYRKNVPARTSGRRVPYPEWKLQSKNCSDRSPR